MLLAWIRYTSQDFLNVSRVASHIKSSVKAQEEKLLRNKYQLS